MSESEYEYEYEDPTYMDLSVMPYSRVSTTGEVSAAEERRRNVETVGLSTVTDYYHLMAPQFLERYPKIKYVQFNAPLDIEYRDSIQTFATKKGLEFIDEQYRGPLKKNYYDSLNDDAQWITEVTYNGLKDDKEEVVEYDLSKTVIRSLPAGAFEGYKCMTSITLPTTLTSLGPNCFKNCTSLVTINLPESLVDIGYGCFCKCRSLKSLRIPSQVSVLQEATFFSCNRLTCLELPTSLIFIGYCFDDCGLTSLELPVNRRLILGAEAFRESNIRKMKIGPNVYCGDSPFYMCNELESLTLENPVTTYKGFYCCTSLVEIKLSENTEVIGDYCFSGCTSLRHVYVPDGVTRIGNGAFKMCTSLKRIVIPWKARLGTTVFENCTCEVGFK